MDDDNVYSVHQEERQEAPESADLAEAPAEEQAAPAEQTVAEPEPEAHLEPEAESAAEAGETPAVQGRTRSACCTPSLLSSANASTSPGFHSRRFPSARCCSASPSATSRSEERRV